MHREILIHLNGPIPRKIALTVLLGQTLVSFGAIHIAFKKLTEQHNTIVSDRDERLKIYDESLNFLLERADDTTIQELNKNLDFWRVVRGSKPRSE